MTWLIRHMPLSIYAHFYAFVTWVFGEEDEEPAE